MACNILNPAGKTNWLTGVVPAGAMRLVLLQLAQVLACAVVAACSAGKPEGSSAPNTLLPAGCGDHATLVSAIQGNAASSPMLGAQVLVEAVVTGDYQETDTTHPARPELGGFYLQEEDADADADPATSEGLFVHDPAKTLEVAEGDRVRVAGTVSEFAGNTQLHRVTSLQVCAAGQDLGQSVTPAAVDLPVPPTFATLDDFYEPLEGMLVAFSDVLAVTEQFELARYGQLLLSEGGPLRQYGQDAALPLNQAGFDAHNDAQARRSIKLDDFNLPQNASPVYFPQPGHFAVDNFIRTGAQVTDLRGVVNMTAGQWMVQAIKSSPPAIVNPSRPDAPPAVAGNVRVAAMNVLNYFNGNDPRGNGQGAGFPTRRGADSPAELQRQTAKIVAAIAAMDADVLGLMEIENDPDGASDALHYLVDSINAEVGAGTYASVQVGPGNGTDEIKVALIYKPAAVKNTGPAHSLDHPSFTDPNQSGSQLNRPALAQTFRVIDPANPDVGAAFTVVVLHLKSRSSACGGPGGDDPIQGNCNGTRSKSMRALLDWLATDPTDTLTHTGKADPDVLIIGDLNSYYQEDPMQLLFNAGYASLVSQSDYTFVYDGRRGSLDHALASPSLLAQQVVGAVWHINADENALLDYDDTVLDSSEAAFEVKPAGRELYAADAYRSSDHDPVLVAMDLRAD
jgi:predicted extracellular nuclease